MPQERIEKNPDLKQKMVVWSGPVGGSSDRPYNISVSRPNVAHLAEGGCWCPKEAVDFFRSIGINAYKTQSYSSGYAAPGCWFSGGIKDLHPYAEEQYSMMDKPSNVRLKHRLIRLEED